MNRQDFVKRYISLMMQPRVVSKIFIVSFTLTFVVSWADYSWHARHGTTAAKSSPRLDEVQLASEPAKENSQRALVKHPRLKLSGESTVLGVVTSQK